MVLSICAFVVAACEALFICVYACSCLIRGSKFTDNAIGDLIPRFLEYLFLIPPRPDRDDGNGEETRCGENAGSIVDEINDTELEEVEPAELLPHEALLDIAMRQHEQVSARIDTLNAATFAVLALPIALLVFITDKYDDFASALRTEALVCLGLSIFIAVSASSLGNLGVWRESLENLDMNRFMIAYISGENAVTDTFDLLVHKVGLLIQIRERKRYFLFLSVICCVGSGALLTTSRVLHTPSSMACTFQRPTPTPRPAVNSFSWLRAALASDDVDLVVRCPHEQ